MRIRVETAADQYAIRTLTTEAFATAEHASGTEQEIIDKLRATGALRLSLVAEEDGVVVGHAAFSPVVIGGQDLGWLGLAPVSVAPSHQGRGIGKAIVLQGLQQVAAAGAQGCVVLGDPAFYSRCGFAPDPRLTFPDVPPEYFTAIRFAGEVPAGAVTYHAAFYE